MPAGQIRLTLRDDDPGGYRDEIAIRSEGFPRLMTRFEGTATSTGRLAAGQLPAVGQYDAFYNLRKAKNRHLSMRFAARAAAVVAERGPGDTSKKAPLAEAHRTNVLDPLSALAAIRHQLRQGRRGAFAVPVYDGARRFDVLVEVAPKSAVDSGLHLSLTLKPIAGFKGETSEDGDPDDAPRPVALTISDDARLMPLSMSVSVYYLPLVVELVRWCGDVAACRW